MCTQNHIYPETGTNTHKCMHKADLSINGVERCAKNKSDWKQTFTNSNCFRDCNS